MSTDLEEEADGTCPICQDLYRDPRSLPCSHTFCRRCLTGHILASQRRAHATDGFMCPLCNKLVTSPDPVQHRFFWARHFPTNQTLEAAAERLAEARAARDSEQGGGGKGAKCQKHVQSEADTWCLYHDVSVCKDCVSSGHDECAGSVLPLASAAAQRKQEVSDMRTRLDTLRDSFQKELENLETLEHNMSAERRATLEDLDDFFDRMTSLLTEKVEELRNRLAEEHDRDMEGVERKRGAWQGMVEEIEETSTVAEMLYMQASQREMLAQFAPLKQQFDNLQYMAPALGTPQACRWRIKDAEGCLLELRSLALEETFLHRPTPPSSSLSTYREVERLDEEREEQRARTGEEGGSNGNEAGPESRSSGASSASSAVFAAAGGSSMIPASSPGPPGRGLTGAEGNIRDRRSHTLHKIRRRRQRVSFSSFAVPQGPGDIARVGKARQVLELSGALDSDKEGYGLGDVCLLTPRDVLLVAYLNSNFLRVFFLPSGHTSLSKTKSNTLKPSAKTSTLTHPKSPTNGSTITLAKPTSSPSMSTINSSNTSDNRGGGNGGGYPVVVCELTHTPCCLAQLSSDLVVATSTTAPQLSFIKMSSSGAKAWKTLDVSRQYRAVARAGTRSLALATYHTGDTENVIDVVKFDEDFRTLSVLRTVTSHPTSARAMGTPLFRAPHSLWVQKGGNIVVSDGDTPAIVGLGTHGNLSFVFKPDNEEVLDSPAGIVGNGGGEIYVADACTQGVLKLSSQGRAIGLVVGPDTGMLSPVALALAPSGTLYVADFYGGIRVFVLQ